jgi:hypothetical protein
MTGVTPGPVLTLEVKRAMSADIADCKLSRPEICERMTLLTGIQFSPAMLNDFTAESKPHRFPLAWLQAWMAVTNSPRLLYLMCKGTAYSVATDEDRRFAEYGRQHFVYEQATRRMEELRPQLEGKL